MLNRNPYAPTYTRPSDRPNGITRTAAAFIDLYRRARHSNARTVEELRLFAIEADALVQAGLTAQRDHLEAIGVIPKGLTRATARSSTHSSERSTNAHRHP